MTLENRRPQLYTARERRAWRQGFASGVEHCTKQLELFRIRFTCRGVRVDEPTHWPVVDRGSRRSA